MIEKPLTNNEKRKLCTSICDMTLKSIETLTAHIRMCSIDEYKTTESVVKTLERWSKVLVAIEGYKTALEVWDEENY